MFPDANYYICTSDGNGRVICIVRYMDLLEFYEEYNVRFGRPPFINSLVTIDDDEFDTLKDKFESDAAIFIGEYRGDQDE